jgi:hypothetical protein
MKYDNARIENGKVYGIQLSEYFSVQLNTSNPSVCPVINFDHMPVETLVKLAFDTLKVKGRPAMKKLTEESLKKIYSGEISWRVMLSKEGATQHQARADMSDDELEDEIRRLRACRAQRPPAPANEDEDLKSNDINSDEYVPAGDDN